MLKPLNGRVLIKRLEAASQIGGLYIPEAAKDKLNRGRVVAVAEDASDEITVGSVVVFGEFSGQPLELDDGEHLIVQDEDVLCLVIDDQTTH